MGYSPLQLSPLYRIASVVQDQRCCSHTHQTIDNRRPIGVWASIIYDQTHHETCNEICGARMPERLTGLVQFWRVSMNLGFGIEGKPLSQSCDQMRLLFISP